MTVIKDPNTLIGKAHDARKYHCYHFIQETLDVPMLDDVSVDTAKDDVSKYKDLFTYLDTPVNNCIALLGDSHIGIYYDNGIYHNDTEGVRYEPLRNMKLKYKGIKYYDIC